MEVTPIDDDIAVEACPIHHIDQECPRSRATGNRNTRKIIVWFVVSVVVAILALASSGAKHSADK